MKPNSSDRQFLSFPAIHPCSTTSPEALLADLSTIASEIDSAGRYQSKYFPTHRRAVRDAVRYGSLLHVFLEDLGSAFCRSALPPSVIVSLSDLYVTLQKLRLLLADCARGGARLWILMNAARVAGEFHSLLRSMAPALEILPLDSMGLSEDIRDIVGLLASQARRVKICVEKADDLTARSVRSILTLFQSGESPDPSDVRRVLSYLDITSWCDCFGEVAFLEEMIFATDGGNDSVLLWSLMGFMIYSMVVLFDSAPTVKKTNIYGFFPVQVPTVALEHLSFDGFRCPISLELMKDPVTVSTGQTYDRSSILRWLKSGNKTCPITGEKLVSSTLIPNSIVQKLLRSYCHENEIPFSEQKKNNKDLAKTLSPATPAAIGAIRMAATFMVGKLASGASQKKSIAAYMIRVLSKWNNFNRICFVEAGAVSWLLHLLTASSSSLQEQSVGALLNLSKHHSGRTEIFESGGLAPIVQTMKNGHKLEVQQSSASILFYLSAKEECMAAIGHIPEAIPSLVELVKNGTYRGKKNAILVLYALLLFSDNQPKILAAEAVEVITDLLEDAEEDLSTYCVGLLAKIAERRDGTNAILKSSTAVDNLVCVLRTSSSLSAREYCTCALISLCKNGGERASSMLEKKPLLMPSLYSLLSDDSRKAGKKARSLLNYMHQFTEQGYSQALASETLNDPLVYAQ